MVPTPEFYPCVKSTVNTVLKVIDQHHAIADGHSLDIVTLSAYLESNVVRVQLPRKMGNTTVALELLKRIPFSRLVCLHDTHYMALRKIVSDRGEKDLLDSITRFGMGDKVGSGDRVVILDNASQTTREFLEHFAATLVTTDVFIVLVG